MTKMLVSIVAFVGLSFASTSVLAAQSPEMSRAFRGYEQQHQIQAHQHQKGTHMICYQVSDSEYQKYKKDLPSNSPILRDRR